MSRYYSMDMEVTNVSPEQMRQLRIIFRSIWAQDEGFYFANGKLAILSANGYLYGEENEMHRRIVSAVKSVIPNCSVITRWTCLEELPYQEYEN